MSRRRAPRARVAGLLGAAVLGGAIASAGVLVAGVGTASGPVPLPAAVALPAGPRTASGSDSGTAPSPPSPKTQQQQDADVLAQPRAVAFLDAMRAAKLPTSRNGLAEVYTARAACAELAKGTTEAALARRIPVGLPTVTKKQAAILVNLAQQHYC